jgi:class 3 adenylate cyclase/tetratricopeptide (TPR) repeat protein
MAEGSGLVTILFTDLVGSTELLSRAGDEEAQRIFRAHHDLISEVASAHGGEEVKWLGDGLMVAFHSALEALRAAVAMQQASRRPVAGERLAIRVGLNAGEALRDAADYFGTPVVVARRLCDRAEAGQILCTETVAGLLAGRSEFAFTDLGKLALKGVTEPVATCEVRSELAEAEARYVTRIPVVGRETELARLFAALAEAAAGHGGVVMVSGEAGIGKTRLLEELSERAEHQGALVIVGRCFESEWSPPYAAFVDALSALVPNLDPIELRADLGPGAPTLAQLVPALRQILSDVGEPAPVAPDEERFRLLDAVAQFLLARARRATVVVCVDDLHWADRGTVAMVRHVARLAGRARLLVVGAYREAEVGYEHPLTAALGALARETEYEALSLHGLRAEGVTALLAELGEHEVSEKVGAAWARETDGNPFFVKELLYYLIEEGELFRGADGRWTTAQPLAQLGLPKRVRDVVGRRLARLSEPARGLLAVASVFQGPFSFEALAPVSGLPEDDALDAFEEILSAQVLAPTAGAETYGFAHNLTRHAVYDEISAPRRGRLHRRVAEALDAASGGAPSPAQAAEIAAQYHHSRSLPGADRGVAAALVAGEHAEAVGSFAKAAGYYRMAEELLPASDERRPRLLGRLGVALAWALEFDEAVKVATEAGAAILDAEGDPAAAAYLSEAAYACASAGGQTQAWALARQGLAHAGERRDVAWARMVAFEYQRREAEDPRYPGIPLETPERVEAARILRQAHLDPLRPAPMEAVFATRAEAAESSNLAVLFHWRGEYRDALPPLEAEAERALARGQLNRAARCFMFIGSCQCALGRLDEARHALDEGRALFVRVGQPTVAALQAEEIIAIATDEGLEDVTATVAPLLEAKVAVLAWALGFAQAYMARSFARLGRQETALHHLELLAPWLERAPAWAVSFPVIACHAAEVLWVTERLDHLATVETALRKKVVEPDFRSPMVDGRLALARLCALTGRADEAASWFAHARRVLDEQGAPPLLAITDYDEALMYVRRGELGDLDRARPLLDSARRQFEEIGMTGWTRRATELARRLG